MANDFNTNYLIAVRVTNLDELRALRDELAALRADAARPIDYQVNVSATNTGGLDKGIEEQVARGVEEGVKKGKRRAGAATGTDATAPVGGTVGFRDADIRRIEQAVDKLSAAVAAMGRADGAAVDAKALGAEVGRAVATELAKLPPGGGGRRSRTATRDVALTPDKRDAYAAELEQLDEAYKGTSALGRNKAKATTAQISALLERNAQLIGGAFQKQVEEYKAQLEQAERLIAEGGTARATGGTAGPGEYIADAGIEIREQLAQALNTRLTELLNASKKAFQERSQELTNALEKGTETITVKKRSRDQRVISAITSSSKRLENALDHMTSSLTTQVTALIDSLAERIQAINVSLPPDFLAQVAHLDAAVPRTRGRKRQRVADAISAVDNAAHAAPERRRRQVDAAAIRARMVSPSQTAGGYVLNNTAFEEADPGRVAEAIRLGNQQAYAAYARQRDRGNKPVRQSKRLAGYEQEFQQLLEKNPEAARSYLAQLDQRLVPIRGKTDELQHFFGAGAVTEGAMRRRDAERALRRSAQATKLLKRWEDSGDISGFFGAETTTQAASGRQLAELGLLPQERSSFRTIEDVRALRERISAMRKDLQGSVDFARVVTHGRRPERHGTDAAGVRIPRITDPMLPRSSPIALRMDANWFASKGFTDDLTGVQRQVKALDKSGRAGYDFTPFGDAELKFLNEMLSDLRYKDPFTGKDQLLPAAQRFSPGMRDHIAALIAHGGEWHYGKFQGFTSPVFQPDIRDIGLGDKALRDATAGELETIRRMAEGKNIGTAANRQLFVGARTRRDRLQQLMAERPGVAAAVVDARNRLIDPQNVVNPWGKYRAIAKEQANVMRGRALVEEREALELELADTTRWTAKRPEGFIGPLRRDLGEMQQRLDERRAERIARRDAIDQQLAAIPASQFTDEERVTYLQQVEAYKAKRSAYRSLTGAIEGQFVAFQGADGMKRTWVPGLRQQVQADRRQLRAVDGLPGNTLKERLRAKWGASPAFQAMQAARPPAPVPVDVSSLTTGQPILVHGYRGVGERGLGRGFALGEAEHGGLFASLNPETAYKYITRWGDKDGALLRTLHEFKNPLVVANREAGNAALGLEGRANLGDTAYLEAAKQRGHDGIIHTGQDEFIDLSGRAREVGRWTLEQINSEVAAGKIPGMGRIERVLETPPPQPTVPVEGTPTAAAASAAATAARAARAGAPLRPVVGGGGGAAGGGAGGGGTPPGGGTFPPPDGPEWEKWAAIMKQLEGTRLNGLAGDLQAMSAAVRAMRIDFQQMPPGALKTLVNTSEKELHQGRVAGRLKELDAKKAAADVRADAMNNRTAAMRERTAAWLASQGPGGVHTMATGVRGAVGQALIGGPAMTPAMMPVLTARWLRGASRLATGHSSFDEILERYNIDQLTGSEAFAKGTSERRVQNAAANLDATRASLFNTAMSAAQLNPQRFASVLPDITKFRGTMDARLEAERQLGTRLGWSGTDVNWSKGQQGPNINPTQQAADMQDLVNTIRSRRVEEDQLANTILKTADAEFRANRVLEQRRTIVERFAGKLGSLSMYALGAGALWGAFAMGRAAFGTAVNTESELARIQGVVGNQTFTERRQIGESTWNSAIEFGAPIGSALQTAKTFAQTGIGVERTGYMTAQALRGQLGAGLEGQQSVEMLIAVDNITRGLVSASDILDRISRVEAKYAVTSQDLSVAIQRVGSLATQLQPQQLGRIDALDLVIGATTQQVQETRVSGGQAATALKFIMSRFTQPEVARNLQNLYGINLGGRNANEMRPIMDILGDVAAKYQELMRSGNTGTAAQLLTQVAGARQVNQAAALFGKWNEVIEAATESAKAWGDTQRRVEIQMNTLAFQTERTKNALLLLANNMLEQGGFLAILKSITAVAGAGAKQGAAVSGLVPLAGAGVLMGGGKLAQMGSERLAARIAQQTATGAAAGVIAANWQSLLKIGGGLAMRAGATLLPFGAIAAGSMLAYQGYSRFRQGEDQTGLPDIDMDALRQSDLYKEFQARAVANAMTVDQLGSAVAGAAALARSDVIGPGGPLAGMERAFTTDDAKRVYDQRLYDETLKSFVKHMAEAVPEIGKIADEAEQTATALAYLKQAATVSQMVTGYVQSWQSEQFNELQTRIAERVRLQTSKGVQPMDRLTYFDPANEWAFGMRGAAFAPGKDGDARALKQINLVLSRTFDVLGSDIGKMLLGGGKTMEQVILAGMRETPNDPMGRVFDRIMRSRFQLTAAETNARTALNKDNKLFAPGTAYEVQRQAELQALAGSSDPTQRSLRTKLLDQATLDSRIYDNLVEKFPGLSGRVPSKDEAGGVMGSQLVMQAIVRAGQRRIRTLREEGLTPEARNMEEALSVLQASANRPNTRMNIMRLDAVSGGRGIARDRMLEAILRYGTTAAVAQDGGNALRGAGVGADILGEQAQASQGLLRGLFEARAQTQADVFRAAARLGNYREVLSIMTGGGTAGSLQVVDNEGNERLQQNIAALVGSAVGQIDPDEKRRLEATLEMQREAVAAITTNQPLFDSLDGKDKDALRRFAFGDMQEAEALTFTFGELVRISQKLVRVTEEQVVGQQRRLYGIEQTNAVREFRTRSAGEWARMFATQDVRRAEGLSGMGAGFRARQRELTAAEVAELALISEQERGQLALLDTQVGLGLPGFGTVAAPLLRQKVQDEARRRRGEVSDRVARERAALGLGFSTDRDLADREFAIRRAEIAGGGYGAFRARMGYAATPEDALDVSRQYLLELEGRRKQTSQELSQAVTQGFRDSLRSYDALRGPALGQRMYQPGLDAISARVTDSFFSALVGPDGVLGEQFQKLFSANIFMEAELIRQAHITGIMTGFAMSGNLGGKALNDIANAGVRLDGSMPGGRTAQLKQLGVTAAFMAGTLGGGALGTKMGVRDGQNYGSEGAQLGSTIGMLAGSAGGPVGMAVGSVVGGIIGGFFGGRVGKDNKDVPEFQALDRIERNTGETVTAIENQTRSLLNLENRLFNVPATFVVPQYAVAAGGGFAGAAGQPAGPVYFNIQITETSNARQTAALVVQELRSNLRSQGTFVSPRGNR